jgi:Glycosyl hydrolase catalytic core
MRMIWIVTAAAALGAAFTAPSAVGGTHPTPRETAAKRSAPLLMGIEDEAQTLYGDPSAAFAALRALRAQVVRVNLYWGGSKWAVANSEPSDPTDPGDPAYNWTLYDRLVRYATAHDVKVVFSILFTPGWANGGRARNVAPTDPVDLQHFAYAAAVRYSGYWTPPADQQDPSLDSGASPLPSVTRWTAWNEPNNPVWLTPQYKRIGKSWRIESAFQYARICNAVYSGIHSVLISPERGPVPGEEVACGVTGPRGNDAPRSLRPEPDPIAFMVAAKRYGLKDFDVWAHHPYPLDGNDAPTYVPRPTEHAVVLGNIGTLLTKLSQLWGPKHLWITEYGYQTNPPNRTKFGISWSKQAAYLRQAYRLASSNPRIDMMLWFLLRDDSSPAGWKSGLETAAGQVKPSANAFASLQP